MLSMFDIGGMWLEPFKHNQSVIVWSGALRMDNIEVITHMLFLDLRLEVTLVLFFLFLAQQWSPQCIARNGLRQGSIAKPSLALVKNEWNSCGGNRITHFAQTVESCCIA